MPTLQLQAVDLAPRFNDFAPTTDNENQSPWLLGQQRSHAAWQLFRRCAGQHLYLSSFTGFDGEALISDLHSNDEAATKPNRLVALSKDNDQILVKISDEDWHNKRWPALWPHAASDTSAEELVPLTPLKFLDQPLSRRTLIGSIGKDGGYQPGLLSSCDILVIPAHGLMEKPSRWFLIKEALKRRYVAFSDSPVQVPVTCKLVILGDVMDYDTLNALDPDFADLVSLFGETQSEWFADRPEDIGRWGEAANQVSRLYTGRPLTPNALQRLARHASRLCDHQGRLSLAWHEIGSLLQQGPVGEGPIDKDHVDQAIKGQVHRHNSVEIYAQRNVEEALVRVDTDGEKVGQINGLTVVDYCGHSFGEPARITVSVHYGDGEVADVERKSELGGNIHAKGMMILSACLYRIFGQDNPLHLSANIVFEQSYQTIDGDSASLAEYCCLISTIANKPVRQDLALTGAVDQFGNVQAIGGINEKIEGFYHLCQYRGLTGKQGVILPKANVRQLNLSDEVINAVAEGKFHLYRVDMVEEALTLLTGVDVGTADDDNKFPDESLYGLVQKRLDRFAGNDDEDDEPGLMARLWQRLHGS